MKKTLISALLAGAALVPLAVSAQVVIPGTDGSVTINGNVQSTTCAISVNNGSKDGIVNLATARTTELSTAGSTGTALPFTVALSGCSSTTGTAKAFFVQGPTINVAGRLSNIAAAADKANNVDLQLLNAQDGVINLAGASLADQASGSAALVDGAATLTYKARYYATAAATAGLVRSNVQFYVAYN